MAGRRELGEGALKFARWYTRSKFALMRDFLDDLETPRDSRDLPTLRSRFLRALRHAERVLWARLAVTLLLAASVLATVISAVLGVLWVPTLLANDIEATRLLLTSVSAFAGSASVLLLVLRLAFDRYLELVDTSATFLAIEIAVSRAGRPPPT